MIRVAIVEDEKKESEILARYLNQFSKENNEEFSISLYKDAISFLDNYEPNFDLIFMDIMMPYIDGISAAKKLRDQDDTVLLFFITFLKDQAIKGYDVGASAFIIKPVSYVDLSSKLRKAIQTIHSRDDKTIIIQTPGVRHRLMVRDLMYVEVRGHICTYHLTTTTIVGRNSLKNLASQLNRYDFMMSSSSFLINPLFIKKISKQAVHVGNDCLELSRLKRKQFLLEFNQWLAKGGDIL